MTEIGIELIEADVYQVTVADATGRTEHRVRVSEQDRVRLAGDASAKDLVEESFRFLLEREPKEAILGRFDLALISHYFPEYDGVIRERLA